MSSSGLTAEQQRQKDEISRQIEDLKSQAAFYSSRSDELSAEDKETLAEAKAGIEKLGQQIDDMSVAQDKLAEHLKQREEIERKREEERKRKVAEAVAAGKTEDDLVNMFVILGNESKTAKWEKTQKEFYDTYKEYFPALKTRELGSFRKEVRNNIRDKETRKNYTEKFLQRSVKDRFDIVTDAFFTLDRYADYALRARDAIINTAEWYTPAEMPEVRKLMDELLETLRKSVDDSFDSLEKKWKKYSTAKDFLRIIISDAKDEEKRDDCRMFQPTVGNYFYGNLKVEVVLATEGILQLASPVMNFFPYYWNVSTNEIWDKARKNEIQDNSTQYIEDINEVVQKAINIIRNDNPDVNDTLRRWKSLHEQRAATFGIYINSLYKGADRSVTIANVKEKLKTSYGGAEEFAKGKECLFKYAQENGLNCLRDLINQKSDIKEIYNSIPKALAEDIKTVRKEKELEKNEIKYSEAVKLSSKPELSDLMKAETILVELGAFKDSKSVLKAVSSKIEEGKSIQYDEARALFSEGTEDSMEKTIGILEKLGQYKDAQTLSAEYKDALKKEKDYQRSLRGIESDSLYELRNAKEDLEGLSGYKNADELLISCNNKLETIMTTMYDKALRLAEEQTEESLTEARSIMSILKPFRDSAEKVEDYGILLSYEKRYKSALDLMDRDDINALQEAKAKFDAVKNYKDSNKRVSECETRIADMKRSYYEMGREAEKTITLTSQQHAISLYKKLGGMDDSEERIKQCENNISIINQISDLEAQIKQNEEKIIELKKQFFTKSEIRSCEAGIKRAKQSIEELKAVLGRPTEIEGNENVAVKALGDAPKKRIRLIITACVIIGVLLLAIAGIKIHQNKKVEEGLYEVETEQTQEDSSETGIAGSVDLTKGSKAARSTEGYEYVEVGDFVFSVPTYFTDDPGDSGDATFYAERGRQLVMLQFNLDGHEDNVDFEIAEQREEYARGFEIGISKVEGFSITGNHKTFRTRTGIIGFCFPLNCHIIRDDEEPVDLFEDMIILQNPSTHNVIVISLEQSEEARYGYADEVEKMIENVEIK